MQCRVEKLSQFDCYYIISTGIIVQHANIIIFVLYGNEGDQHWGCYIFRGS